MNTKKIKVQTYGFCRYAGYDKEAVNNILQGGSTSMKMKVFTILALAGTVGLSGCGANKSESKQPEPTKAAESTDSGSSGN